MRRPKAISLFCSAGGDSRGLYEAGFDVVGVDILPQKNYPYAFVQGDALQAILTGADFVWASPPCQGYSDLKDMHNAKEHAKLIEPVRAKLKRWGGLYCIENVEGAPLRNPVTLCGSMFNLGVNPEPHKFYQLRRHRLFETNFPLPQPKCVHTEPTIGVYGGHARCRSAAHGGRSTRDFVGYSQRVLAAEAMEIDWMTLNEMSQAIPPPYAEMIGRYAMKALRK